MKRQCKKCLTSKPLEEFGFSAYYLKFGAKDGRAIYCKQCNREARARAYYSVKHMVMNTKVRIADSYRVRAA